MKACSLALFGASVLGVLYSAACGGDAFGVDGAAGKGNATAGTSGAGTGGKGEGGTATGATGGADSSEAGGPDASLGGAPEADGGAPTQAGTSGTSGTGGTAGSSAMSCDAGTADCNHDPKDGCEASLDDAATCGSCATACSQAAPYCERKGERYTCTNPAQQIDAQRLELPCIAQIGTPELCETVANHTMTCPMGGKVVKRTFTMGGDAGTVYNVTLRFRGVLEPKLYTGGKAASNHVYIGGTPVVSGYNDFGLKVSSPAQTYYFNSVDEMAGEKYQSFTIDTKHVVQVEGGATITLQAHDPDCAGVRNCQTFTPECKPFVIAGVPPAAGFNGQFLQVDVVAISKAE